MKRFYNSVSVGDGNAVLLDGRTLKSPRGAALSLPSHALAEAIAEEWRVQEDEIVPQSMPFTKLANTAIDGVTPRRDEVIAEIVAFAKHDHLCYRTDAPAELVRRQSEAWDPLLEWTAEHYGAPLIPASGITSVAQPETSIAALRKAVEALDPFALAALHVIASICGSLVLGLAVVDKRVSVEEAFALSQIDERFQAEKWGFDSEAERRRLRLLAEITDAGRFLRLLKA